MSDDFKVISEFCCHGKQMVAVRIGNAAHVMSLEEWHKVYGRMYLKMGGFYAYKAAKYFFGKKNIYRTCI